MESNLPVPARALAVGAHPDDVEFGCGARSPSGPPTAARSSTSCAPTGPRAPGIPTPTRPSSSSHGATSSGPPPSPSGARARSIFLGWPDGELESGLRQRFQVASAIRRIRPEVVLGHDPWKRYRLHPDHRNAGFLVTDGIVAARDPLFFPELGDPPHRPSDPAAVRGGRAGPSRGRDRFRRGEARGPLAHTRASCARRWGSPNRRRLDERRTRRSLEFKHRVTDRLAEHGREAGFAAAEAFKRIDKL